MTSTGTRRFSGPDPLIVWRHNGQIQFLDGPTGDGLSKYSDDREALAIGLNCRPILRQLLSKNCGAPRVWDVALACTLASHAHPDLSYDISHFERREPAAETFAALTSLQQRARENLRLTCELEVLEQIELPLLPILAEMENEGIRCDKGKLLAADEAITRRLEAVTAEIHNQAGSIFNIDNTQCLGAVLYERLKLSDDPPRTRTGLYATDESALSALPNHPMIEAVLEYRRLVTLKRSYLNALPQSIRPDTGRIHTTFEQLESANGRLISRNPNLQNIPIASEEGRDIRRAFIPRDERFLILSADYSQLELRLLAHFCGDETLLRAFRCGTDVHTATASRVFNVPVEQVTELMRAEAKAINYGIAYGMSAFGLAKRTGRSIKESRSTIDDYFARMPRIQEYSDRIVFQARRQGFVTTICGRRRYIPEIKDRNFSVRRRSERIAVCSPIQGSAADLIKLAMISIHRAIQERNLKTRLLLQVHDELVFDLYRPEQSEVVELVTEKMETALNLAAPLTVNIGCGSNWLELN